MLIQELALEDCRNALLRASFGHLACAFENQPYVVPIQFCVEGHYAYSFAMPGRKVEWMRENPLVCLEIDAVAARDDWTSVVALGRFEELPDTPEFRSERLRALELLQASGMWWHPGSIPLEHSVPEPDASPIFYRIVLEQLTGHRALPARGETAPAPARSWLGRLFHPSASRL